MSEQDTIAAIATPAGVGGIGIIRLSGARALEIVQTLTQSPVKPKTSQFRNFLDTNGVVIDHGIVLYFMAPNSFTGEDVVEIQGHAGSVLQEMLLSRVCELGARLAHAGEFSERAFHNDKLDLAQAEAIADLIESGSQAAARAAMRSLQGVFSNQIHQLVKKIIGLRVFVEAALDFAEEEIDFLGESDIQQQLQTIIQSSQKILSEAKHGQVLHDGLTLAIAGQPNAGKSSLLNYLAGYDAAIVTDIAGTTRDVIREHIALKGIPVKAIDTAGLRESNDPVEQEGIKRAWNEIEQADVVLHLIDVTQGVTQDDEIIQQRLKKLHVKRVFTKADLIQESNSNDYQGLMISTKTGDGLQELIEQITEKYSDFNQNESTFIARKRHVEALKQGLSHLNNAQAIFTQRQSGELMAEDLRQAQQSLDQITGEFTTEDLLGQIFSSFCIGK